MNRARAYRQLWRVVDGAVFDALYTHPEYLTPAGKRWARQSVVKRVTGAVYGFAGQSAQGRSGVSPAPDRVAADASGIPHGEISAVSRWRAALAIVARKLFGRRA